MRFAIAVLAAALISGCTTIGNKFDPARADELRPGVSTVAEAKDKLGEPISTATDANGNTVLQWKYARGSLVGASGARLDIIFDKDGKMVRVARKSSVGL